MDVGVGCTLDAIAASRCCGMEDGAFGAFFCFKGVATLKRMTLEQKR